MMCALILLFFTQYSLFAGFSSETLVLTSNGHTQISNLAILNTVRSYNDDHDDALGIVNQKVSRVENRCVHLHVYTLEQPIICSLDQKFYCAYQKVWKAAKDLSQNDLLLCRDGILIAIDDVQIVYGADKLYDISVSPLHTFFITEHNILVHNIAPMIIAGFSLAFGGGSIECLGLYGGIVVLCSWLGFEITKDKKGRPKLGIIAGDASGGSPDPDDPNNRFNKGNRDIQQQYTLHKHGIYQDAPYHTRHGNRGKSPRPKDGQKALDNSLSLPQPSTRRIGISCGQFVVLSQTSKDLYHGHIRSWDELDSDMQNALRDAKLVNFNGKIL